jgi:hypothetical protein
VKQRCGCIASLLPSVFEALGIRDYDLSCMELKPFFHPEHADCVFTVMNVR